jgi:hypothetical protein
MPRGTCWWLILATWSLATANDASQPPRSGKPPSLEELEHEGRYQELRDDIDQLEAWSHEMTREKRLHCLRAFGNRAFCNCLAEEAPVGATFLEYIQVVTATKETLEDSRRKAKAEEKSMLDRIVAAREACVVRAFGQ